MSITKTEHEGIIFYNKFQTDIAEAPTSAQVIIPQTTIKRSPDFQLLRPFFGWMNTDTIQKMFEHTTQYARLPTGTMLKKAFRSPHPALNVYRFCFGMKVTDIYGIKHDNRFANNLEDTIIQRGPPNQLLSDRGQAIISNKAEDILQMICIDKWQSEPHQHHQNPAERRYQTVKNATNRILDRTGTPLHLIIRINMSIDAVPLTKLLDSAVDISPLLCFHFWGCVYYHQSKTSFPSDSKEGLRTIVGISEYCGHALIYKVLTADTGHVMYRSPLRPVTTGDANLRAMRPP
jgi:hypothetical protein